MESEINRPLAIELAFDPASDHRLGRVWSHLSALYDRPMSSELGVRPHITLALFRSTEPQDPTGLAGSAADLLEPFRLNLTTVAMFPGNEGVVFLRPEPSSQLYCAHAKVDELLAESRDLVDVLYRPAFWQPHCTMAINVPKALLDTVLSACRSSGACGEVQVEQIQVVRYRPVTEVWRARLTRRTAV